MHTKESFCQKDQCWEIRRHLRSSQSSGDISYLHLNYVNLKDLDGYCEQIGMSGRWINMSLPPLQLLSWDTSLVYFCLAEVWLFLLLWLSFRKLIRAGPIGSGKHYAAYFFNRFCVIQGKPHPGIGRLIWSNTTRVCFSVCKHFEGRLFIFGLYLHILVAQMLVRERSIPTNLMNQRKNHIDDKEKGKY